MPALDGKVALVIGGARGIGAAVSRRMVAYLASPDAAFVTGAVYNIDGGWSA